MLMITPFALIIIAILFVHWVADFVLQTEWMATNKSSNIKALSAHVAVYSLVLFYAVLFAFPTHIAFLWAIFNGAVHFCVDFVTSRCTKALWDKGRVHDFFVMVGLDQFIHAMTLILTLSYVLQL